MLDTRRIGKFIVDRSLLYNIGDIAYEVFKGMVVIRCELYAATDEFHYTAIGPMFDTVAFGERIPKYTVKVVVLEEGKCNVTFIRKENNG